MSLDGLLAYHCGPALAGIKPANIVNYRGTAGAVAEIRRLNARLNPVGIYIDVLSRRGDELMLMVYRADRLREYLLKPAIRAFLKKMGYPSGFSLGGYIDFLRQRLGGKEFPHEIGAFLGYPLHDIYGFIKHRGRNCIFSGEWKVYAEPVGAMELFSRYWRCRRGIARRLKRGESLEDIFSGK